MSVMPWPLGFLRARRCPVALRCLSVFHVQAITLMSVLPMCQVALTRFFPASPLEALNGAIVGREH